MTDTVDSYDCNDLANSNQGTTIFKSFIESSNNIVIRLCCQEPCSWSIWLCIQQQCRWGWSGGNGMGNKLHQDVELPSK
jgi:hypothetical protein